MTEQQQKTATFWGAGGVAFLGALFAAFSQWESIRPFLDWAIQNLERIVDHSRMEIAIYAIGFGAAFGACWLWVVPDRYTSLRGVRALSCLITLTTAVSMHDTTQGIRDAAFCALAGPMLAEYLIRRWCAWRKLPLPQQMQE